MHFNLLEMAKGFSDGSGRQRLKWAWDNAQILLLFGGYWALWRALTSLCLLALLFTGSGTPGASVESSFCSKLHTCLFFFFLIILFHLNGGGACLKTSATLFFEVQKLLSLWAIEFVTLVYNLADGFAVEFTSKLESLTEGVTGTAVDLCKPRFEQVCGLHSGVLWILPL